MSVSTTITIIEHIFTFVFVVFCVAFEISVEKREKRLVGIVLRRMNLDFPDRKRICNNSDKFCYFFALPVFLIWTFAVSGMK